MTWASDARTGRAGRMVTTLVLAGLLGAASLGATAEPGLTLRAGGATFELVHIPAGRFRMGSSTGDSDERPVHEVNIDYDFWIGRTEVTVRQFRAFVEATGYKTDAEQAGWANTCPLPGLHPHQRGLDWRRPGLEPADDHPAVVISRRDAMAFCRWLREQTGRACRLPTEAEWEYAARAGRQGDSAKSVGDAAWYEENTSGVQPVGSKKANPWGLHDMQGNAWEWCLDVWRADYHNAPADGSAWMDDPAVPQRAWRYVLRGGSWASPARQLSLSGRERRIQNYCRPDTGFRIVQADDPQPNKTPLASVRQGKASHATLTADKQTGRTILTIPGARFEFVRIPAGEFMMGGNGEIEKPAHKVRIDYEFEMGATEVTVGQFRAFIDATGYLTDGQKGGYGRLRQGGRDWESEDVVDWHGVTFDQPDDHPAIFISWYDAMAFCHWLSVKTGQDIRLPSEAEWEYTCRAGTTGLFAGELSDMGWYQYNSCDRTHPVARKRPNAWGLYDMHGNVWEWCLDFFATSYDGAPADGRPRWDVDRSLDVISRGGSFINPPGWLASGCRMGTSPSASHDNNGFRLVRELRGAGRAIAAAESDNGQRTQSYAGQVAAERPTSPALAPLDIELPKPTVVGLPSHCFNPPHLEKPRPGPRPPFLAPVGTTNVAIAKPITSSAPEPIMGHLHMITDGDKSGAAGHYVELLPSLQHVTIDLGKPHEISAVLLWQDHMQPRVYFDVIVQVSNDPHFAEGVETIFNNDQDNSAKLGKGAQLNYYETYEGRLIDAGGVRGRYARLYSNGNAVNDLNHYIEVEVYGRPDTVGADP